VYPAAALPSVAPPVQADLDVGLPEKISSARKTPRRSLRLGKSPLGKSPWGIWLLGTDACERNPTKFFDTAVARHFSPGYLILIIGLCAGRDHCRRNHSPVESRYNKTLHKSHPV
jgi:hypothetical protein